MSTTTTTSNWKSDLNWGLAAFGIQIPDSFSLDKKLSGLTDRPADSIAKVAALSAIVFYALERGRNPKVKDYWDALVYTSTCLSVGYGDIFAKTPLGKVLGSTLMTYGPAIAARSLDGEKSKVDAQAEIMRVLKEIQEKITTDPKGNTESGQGPEEGAQR